MGSVIDFAQAKAKLRPRSLARQYFDLYGFYIDCPVQWGPRRGYLYADPGQLSLDLLVTEQGGTIEHWPRAATQFWEETTQ